MNNNIASKPFRRFFVPPVTVSRQSFKIINTLTDLYADFGSLDGAANALPEICATL